MELGEECDHIVYIYSFSVRDTRYSAGWKGICVERFMKYLQKPLA